MNKSAIKTTDNRLFQALLFFTFLLLFTELFSWMVDGLQMRYARGIIWLSNFAYFMLIPFNSLLWARYLHYHIYRKALFYKFPLIKRLVYIPIAFYIAILSMTDCVYYIDSANHYIRGSFYFLPYVLSGVYLVLALMIAAVSLFSKEGVFQRKQNGVMCILMFLPISAGIVQAFICDIWIALPITALAELFIYVQIKKQQITLDVLTGINNRGSFDSYLKNRLEQKEKKVSYYLFMMDMDHFKQINDTYGHLAGDDALRRTAALLGRFFSGKHAFLARYGGDEFCAIEACKDDRQAEEIVEKLHEIFSKEGKDSSYNYELSISIGYAQLEVGEVVSQRQLMQKADAKMYEEKRGKKV